MNKELMDKLDALSPPPNERASKIYQIIQPMLSDLTDYDVTCFAVEWLNSQALSNFEFMKPEIKTMSSLFYKAHYSNVIKSSGNNQSNRGG